MGKGSVLLIDDDEIQHFIMENMLKRIHDGLDLISARCGTEGKELALSGHLFILLDINMPDTTGWEMLKYWRQTKAVLPPLYMLSSSPDPADTELAEQWPELKGYILKPIQEKQLRQLVEQYAPVRET